MSLKQTWIDQDETMDASPDVVNDIAHAVIENEEDIEQLREDLDNLDVGGGGGDVDLSNYYTKNEVDEQIDDIEPFIVNVTYADGGTFTADKTYDEIIASYESGKTPTVAYTDAGGITTHVSTIFFYEGAFSFTAIYGATSFIGRCNSDNEWYLEEGTLALTEYVDEQIGEIETALDGIIAIQNQLMGVSE